MDMNELLTALGAVAFLLTTLTLTLRSRSPGNWRAPVLLAAAFLAFSLYTVAREGLFGFWPVHASSFWGNQVWLDLLLALGVSWVLLLPRMRTVGMRPLPWLLLIVCSGSIGMLATLARLCWHELRRA